MSEKKLPGTATYRRTVQHYTNQQGLCWICNEPMLPPILDPGPYHSPSKWMATLDHLSPKDGTKRKVKAAHAFCNSYRHHQRDLPQLDFYIKGVKARFQNRSFFITLFGKEKWEVYSRSSDSS